MVFTVGAFQCQSTIHTRHTFHSLPCLHTRKSRAPFSTQASGEDPLTLSARPSLSGPPKRPAAPAKPEPSTPQVVVEQQRAAQTSSKQPGHNGNGAQQQDKASANAAQGRPQSADKRQHPPTPSQNRQNNRQKESSRPKRQGNATQQAMKQVRAQSEPGSSASLRQPAAPAAARPATDQATAGDAAPPPLPSVAKPPSRQQPGMTVLPSSHHMRQWGSHDRPDQSYDRPYRGPAVTDTVDLAEKSAARASSTGPAALQRPDRRQQTSATASSTATFESPSATPEDQPALARPPSHSAAAAAPAPTLQPPPMAEPPKRPPRPAQQSYQSHDPYGSRQQLSDGSYSPKASYDRAASMPSDLPDIPALPPPTPQTSQSTSSEQHRALPAAGSEGQTPAEQPTLAAKPGLRAPPTRAPARQSIDPAKFEHKMGLHWNPKRLQSVPGPPDAQSSQGSADKAAGNTNGAAAVAPAPGRPAKNKRGKKRGEDDQEDGRGKGKGRGNDKIGMSRGDVSSRRVSRQERKQRRIEAKEAGKPEKEDIIEVGLEGMSVQDLAEKLAVAPTEVLRELFMKGIMAQVNQVLDFETVQIVGEAFEVDIIEKEETQIKDLARKTMDYLDEDDLDFLQPRPPVVVVMGHVDHGKTSLLDTIRKSKVAAGEAGGITQAIGAYTVGVDIDQEKKNVTFLDTPGHEAFSAMRARGARVTDIAIVVVAADDGVRPQTLEAISHAQAAEVPIVVAINKVDKDGANPERVKQELSEAGLLPEEWGGKTPMMQISAKKGTGVHELLETVALTAELEQLMANPDKAAAGTVLEAHLDKRVGAIATLLVQTGTLRIGDVVVAGAAYGKVRSMKDNFSDKDTALPSTAVQMSGLNSVPIAGDDFVVAKTLEEGRKVAEVAEAAQRVGRLADQAGGGSMITTKTLASFDDDGEGEEEVLHRLNIILKTDASGSLEAVKAALGSLPQDSVVLRFLLATPNDITISDVDLAAASRGTVLGFNVEPSEAVLAAAKHQGVTVKSYKVIYDLLDDMRAAMEGKLAALEERVPIGQAEVRAVFGKGSKLVAGCMVTEGVLRAECFVVVKRGRKQVYEGELSSLRRVKESISEIGHGNECGVGCKGYIDWEEGDKIEAFQLVAKRRTLEDSPPAPAFVAA